MVKQVNSRQLHEPWDGLNRRLTGTTGARETKAPREITHGFFDSFPQHVHHGSHKRKCERLSEPLIDLTSGPVQDREETHSERD